MASQIHAIGFQDTIITLQQHHDLSYILGASNNLWNEIVIKAPPFSTKIKELRADRIDQDDWLAALPYHNHEIGRIVTFDKNIWIKKASVKLRSSNNLDFKKPWY